MSYKSTHTGAQIDAGVSAALNPDTTVTPSSTQLVTSGAVAAAIANANANDTVVIPYNATAQETWTAANNGNANGATVYWKYAVGNSVYQLELASKNVQIDYIEVGGMTYAVTATSYIFQCTIDEKEYRRYVTKTDDSYASTTSFSASAVTTTSLQTALTFDNVPTDGSNNPVKSNGVYDALALKAPLDSPALTGTPTAPTPDLWDVSDKLATTEFVKAKLGGVVYGFHVDGAESDPAAAVTYLKDAVGLTPAAMNFSTGVFSYGSWANAFFMPRPCMLKYDGTVDYYLDPDDFTKKVDGTASDVADDTYGGNAMMEWGHDGKHIWMKCVPDSGNPASGSVYISDTQRDTDYHCFPFVNNQGDLVDHFYTPIYGGSIDGNGKLRSLSGKTLSQGKTMTEQSAAARANNPGEDVLWDIENLAERMLINALLILMGKSLNTQAVFGNGRQGQASSATSMLTTGTLNDKGLFWGASDNTHDIKVFGMSLWGNQWRRVNGYLLVNGVMNVKMTHGRQDGTTADDYNQTGSGYISLGSLGTYSGAFQDAMTFNGLGFFPRSAGGSSASSTTFWCDPIWTNTSRERAAMFGGSASSTAAQPGAFCVFLGNEPADAYWTIGAAPSCKPLAP